MPVRTSAGTENVTIQSPTNRRRVEPKPAARRRPPYRRPPCPAERRSRPEKPPSSCQPGIRRGPSPVSERDQILAAARRVLRRSRTSHPAAASPRGSRHPTSPSGRCRGSPPESERLTVSEPAPDIDDHRHAAARRRHRTEPGTSTVPGRGCSRPTREDRRGAAADADLIVREHVRQRSEERSRRPCPGDRAQGLAR